MTIDKARVLLTGSSGFVGRSTMAQLLAEGAIVRGATRTPSNSTTDIQSPSLGKNAEWASLLESTDIVIHAAARAHVLNESEKDPIKLFREVNTVGTLRLARQAAEAGVKRFLFLSSIGVNGRQSIKPFTESDVPDPVEPYSVSKLEAEKGLMDLSRDTGMGVVIIRPALVYGPGAPGNFGKLANAVRRGIPLPLGAVTENKRTLVGLHNLVDLIVKCSYHPAAVNQIFLAGDDEDISTADLLRRMAKAYGMSPRLVSVPLPMLRAMARVAGKSEMVERLCGSLQVDITKARELLGWNPPLTVDEGLARAAEEFYRNGQQ